MAIRTIVAICLTLLVASCAQVGVLSGGDRDATPPRVTSRGSVPENGSTSFSGKSISLEFDEFVVLNNPQQNITMIPAHARLETKLVKKTVHVSWKEDLEPNTTYVIAMNGAVKDVTEGNDSLMFFVFSTGTTLDTSTYSVSVQNAWTNSAMQGITVGLFQHKDSVKPYYFSKTDADGWATFRYLHPGTYFVRAFQDDNSDLCLQPFESVGFINDPVQIDTNLVDSIPLRVFKPTALPKINSFKPYGPEGYVLSANFSLAGSQLELDGQSIPDKDLYFIDEDSVLLLGQKFTTNTATLIVRSDSFSDTVSCRITDKDRQCPAIISLTKKDAVIIGSEDLVFEVNGKLNAIDTALIQVTDPADSTELPFTFKLLSENRFSLKIEAGKADNVFVQFREGAATLSSGSRSVSFERTLDLLGPKEVGALLIDVRSFNTPLVLELVQNKIPVRTISLSTGSVVELRDLVPGDYSFRIIVDENKNGKWDTGNFQEGKHPEKVLWFTKPTRVRPNWDVSVQLSPQ